MRRRRSRRMGTEPPKSFKNKHLRTLWYDSTGGVGVTMQSASALTVGNPCFLSAHGRTCIVEVLGVSNGTIWVTFPWAVPLDEGTGVELMFQQDEGHVAFHTRVSSAPGTPVGLMLERAESCADGQRRRDWRVATDYPVWL